MNHVTVDEFLAMQKRGTKGKSRGTHTAGTMNKTESAYAAILDIRKVAGEIARYEFEAVTFKLAEGCRFTPDFMVVFPMKFPSNSREFEFIDVKGGGPVEDDALVKIKMAAKLFPEFGWAQEKKQKKRDGGGWLRREFGGRP